MVVCSCSDQICRCLNQNELTQQAQLFEISWDQNIHQYYSAQSRLEKVRIQYNWLYNQIQYTTSKVIRHIVACVINVIWPLPVYASFLNLKNNCGSQSVLPNVSFFYSCIFFIILGQLVRGPPKASDTCACDILIVNCYKEEHNGLNVATC